MHNEIGKLKSIFAANKEIKQWYCLGDIVDFLEPGGNKDTMDFWIENCFNVPCLIGNHEEIVSHDLLNISFTHQAAIRKFCTSFEFLLPNKETLYAFHNKPKCNWSFIDQGKYTYREFVDNFSQIWMGARAVLIGHNHKQFVMDFEAMEECPQIWSVGAVKLGQYAIIDKDGLQLKRL